MNLGSLLRRRGAKPRNKARDGIDAQATVPAMLASAGAVHLWPDPGWLLWFCAFQIFFAIVLRKVWQWRAARTPQTLFTIEERAWWHSERRCGPLRYVLVGGGEIGLLVTLFAIAVPIFVNVVFGTPISRIRLREFVPLMMPLFIGLGILARLRAWATYQDDEREWQRKHAGE